MPPLLPYAITLIAGILIQGSGISVFFMFLPLAASVTLFICKKPTPALLTLTVLFGYIIAAANAPARMDDRLTMTECHYSGVVKELREHESSRTLIISIDSCDGDKCATFLTKLFIPSTLPVIDETERINFTSTLSHITSGTEIPDEIDFNAPLIRKGIIAETSIQPDSLHTAGIEPGILNSITRYRQKIVMSIASTALAPETKTFLITTITGDKSYLTADMRELFSKSGIAHVLALSGMHVGILACLIFIFLLPLELTGMRSIRITVTITLLWLFAILTGLSPSVTRAVTMATLLFIGKLLQRVHSPFNTLSFAAIVILLFSPQAIYAIGFQLTFIAVASIFLISHKLNPFQPANRMPYLLASYVTVTIAAMLGTGIVSAYYFGVFPIYSLITNVVTTLVLPLLLGGGVTLILLSVLGVKCGWLTSVTDTLYAIIDKTAGAITSLPGSHIDGIIMSELVIAMYFAALAMFTVYLYKRRKVWIISMTATTAASIIVGLSTSPQAHPDMLFIPKSTKGTSVLIKEGRMLWLLTTAPPVEIPELKSEYEHRYNRFMARCGIDSITPMPDNFNMRNLSRQLNLLHYHGKNILIANSSRKMPEHPSKIDYAVVCRGFKGDITDFARTMRPDTLVLSADIHKRRNDRYAKELTATGQNLKELRKGILILTAE
ncbi:MAG: ComEC/Rec2 family competence protein [Duncaniella sp.]|nr:ComEC/Rec2 family competence protein [Duncaniella sp.]